MVYGLMNLRWGILWWWWIRVFWCIRINIYSELTLTKSSVLVHYCWFILYRDQNAADTIWTCAYYFLLTRFTIYNIMLLLHNVHHPYNILMLLKRVSRQQKNFILSHMFSVLYIMQILFCFMFPAGLFWTLKI